MSYRDGKFVKFQYYIDGEPQLIWMTMYYSEVLDKYVMATCDECTKWEAFDEDNRFIVNYDKSTLLRGRVIKLDREAHQDVYEEQFKRHPYVFWYWFGRVNNPHYVIFQLNISEYGQSALEVLSATPAQRTN